MERVEPSNIHAFTAPLGEVPPKREEAPRSDKRTDAKRTETKVADEAQDTPHVEVTPVYISEDSGAIVPWASFLFVLFWLGGISSYVVGLFGWDRLVQLQLSIEWYGLIASILVVPVILVIFIALLSREMRVLRRQSVQLAHAAAELTEPEDHAARSMTKLGRAIRRELDLFNTSIESASARMATLESQTNERLALIERTAIAAQERVDRATGKLGSEREKLAQFTHALDQAVLSASETLTQRLQDARTAARNASESLHNEHGAIAGLISTLQAASTTVANKASESAKEIERQAQRLDAASEAAAARSEQVVARHERQRAALAETIDRLKQENDHMARALDYQREGLNKLVTVMVDETKKIGTFTVEGARRLDETAAIMAQRIVETTQLFTRESEKLRTSTELTTSGLEQAMQTIRSTGDTSFDAAGRLGSVLISLRETAVSASQQIEGTVGRLGKLLQDLPAEAAGHAHHLRTMLDQQAGAMSDLSSRVGVAFDRVQAIENKQQTSSLKSPPQQASIPNFNAPPAGHLAPPARGQVPPPAERHPAADQLNGEPRGWFGLAKRFVRAPGDDGMPPLDERGPVGAGGTGNGWDMKSLLAAAENEKPQPAHTRRVDDRLDRTSALPANHAPGPRQQQPRQPQHPQRVQQPAPIPASQPPQHHGETNHTSSRHMIETLQAMAIDLDRFLEDDPPLDLLRRYRAGERNVFARRLVSILGREQTERIARKYREDGEFKETVERYVQQFEALMEQTARSDRENVLVETYLTSQTGKVYVALASAIGRLA
ncbi:MAG: hypothetical protein JNL06_19705 [Alphaproteobacteria bacterium]|nr:hypothetical protein [Alphaproteobacteria bacterium]